MEIHIGKEIHSIYKKRRLGQAEMARLINTSPQNLNALFKRKSIDTEQLLLISKVLDFDFFGLYSEELGKLPRNLVASLMLGPNSDPMPISVQDELAKCKVDKVNLEEKYKLQTENSSNLQKYVKLLEEKLRKLESSEGQVK